MRLQGMIYQLESQLNNISFGGVFRIQYIVQTFKRDHYLISQHPFVCIECAIVFLQTVHIFTYLYMKTCEISIFNYLVHFFGYMSKDLLFHILLVSILRTNFFFTVADFFKIRVSKLSLVLQLMLHCRTDGSFTIGSNFQSLLYDVGPSICTLKI